MESKKTPKRISYVVFISLAVFILYSLIDPSVYQFVRSFFGDSQINIINHEKVKTVNTPMVKKEPWITVFVHGSFGSLVGLLSFTRVVKDDLYGSLYKDIIKKMRQDPFFYKDQPMLDRGLVKIDPTFNIRSVGNKKYAAYPIIKAYDVIQNMVKPNQEENFYYTFGWSGLMSQHRRRLESIRLYNCLREEVKKFKEKGITPKIRILAHSHGGNLCLNLAAINHVIKGSNPVSFEHDGYKKEVASSLQKMLDLIKKLPHKPQLDGVKGQRHYDYAPIDASLRINELIVLGTPIQPETEFFCLSDMFDKFYHLYSGEDVIQKLDGVTTKQYKSEQRLHDDLLSVAHNKIIQAKIMYGRDIHDKKLLNSLSANDIVTTKDQPESFWDKISGIYGIFSKKFKDPGHKELWFATWKSDSENNGILAPLPAVVLTPIILWSLENIKNTNDVDINVAFTKKSVDIMTFKHNDGNIQKSFKIPLSLVKQLKEKFKPWNPQDLLDSSGMEGVYKYLM